MNHISDEKLTQLYVQGESEALETLIKRYLSPVYAYIFKQVRNQADTEDITQEVFVKVWKNIEKFKSDQKFRSWLFTIAKNTTVDFFKKKKAIPFSVLDNPDEEFKFADFLEDKSALALEKIQTDERDRELNLAIENLAPAYKTTLNLRYKEGLKFREIAELLKESVDTIKTRHRRALEYLKRYLIN